MKIRFNERVEVKFVTDICCFSGLSKCRLKTMNVGQILEVVEVPPISNKIPKVKTRPGEPPKHLIYSLVLDNSSKGYLHPDRVDNVPGGSFEIVDE